MDFSDEESDYDEGKEDSFVRNLEEEGELLKQNLLPNKSRRVYELAYAQFLKWLHEHKSPQVTENLLLVHFQELAQTYSPHTLWSKWSMIKALPNLRSNIRVGDFQNLKQFLKNFNKSYKAKKAAVFRWVDIEKFVKDKNNLIYLAMKVVLIFGICGAMRCDEMIKLHVSDVRDMAPQEEMNENNQKQFQYYVTITDTKTFVPRRFFIGSIFYAYVKSYADLRPANMESSRFSIFYSKGKCTRQNMVKNRPGEIAKSIAAYLNLSHQGDFTGHSFRRTAATLLSNSGANMVAVKALGGWLSDAVAQGYIENSDHNRCEIFDGVVSANQSLTALPIQSVRQSLTVPKTFPRPMFAKDSPQVSFQRPVVRSKSHVTKPTAANSNFGNQYTSHEMPPPVTRAQNRLSSSALKKNTTCTVKSSHPSHLSSSAGASSAGVRTSSLVPPIVSIRVGSLTEKKSTGASPALVNMTNSMDPICDNSSIGDRDFMDHIENFDTGFETEDMNNNLSNYPKNYFSDDNFKRRRILHPRHNSFARGTQNGNYQSMDFETSFVQSQNCTINNLTINKSSGA